MNGKGYYTTHKYEPGEYWEAMASMFERDKVYVQCLADAKEYFTPLGILLHNETARMRLPKEQKERVVSFLKSRKEWYDVHGYVEE